MSHKLIFCLLCSLFFSQQLIQAQCTISCEATVDVALPLSGQYELSLDELIATTTGTCPDADSLEIVPASVGCSAIDLLTPYIIQNVNTGEEYCRGLIAVTDTIEREVICRDTVLVYLPADGSRKSLIQQDFVFAIVDNCDRNGRFDYFPQSAACADAGSFIPYLVSNEGATDSVCTGIVAVMDTVGQMTTCKDQIIVDLSPSGFPGLLFPPSVIDQYGTNCNASNNFRVSPTLLTCDLVGLNDYYLIDRENLDTICSGQVLLRDPILPQVNCEDTLNVYLAADGSPIVITPEMLVTQFTDNCTTVDDLIVAPNDTLDCGAVDTLSQYELFAPGMDQVLCSGVIAVIDTFSAAIECQPSVLVTLPLTYEGFELTTDLFVLNNGAVCNKDNVLEIVPSTLFCYHAGQQLTYQIKNTNNGEVECTGLLTVEDIGEVTVTCKDTAQIILPASGGDYELNWQDVVVDFSDNCLSVFDLDVTPGTLGCTNANSFVPYTVNFRDTDNIVCQGIVEVIDDSPLEVSCLDTVRTVISPSGFPGLVFPPNVINTINDNCVRLSNFRVIPSFYLCPDPGTEYHLIVRETNEVLCSGVVVVTGPPSRFGRCDDDNGARQNDLNGLNLENGALMDIGDLVLFPNPTPNDQINFALPAAIKGRLNYKVFNLMGQIQNQGILDIYGGELNKLDLNQLDAGAYILKIESEEGQVYQQRFIKSTN